MNYSQTDVMSSTHTHVSQIGLDLNQQKSIVERKIQSDLLKILLEVQNRTQQKIKQEIKDRQVYIMFEPDLGCDPKNDHLYPKNILPLFDQAITTAFQQSNRATILCLQKYIFEGINQLELNDLSNDLEMQDLEIMNLQLSNRKLIKLLEDTNKRNQAEHKKLLEYLIKLKEQLFQVSASGNAYAPDMGMFDSAFMMQSTAEPVGVEDFGTDYKTKIIQKLRQRLHKLEETLAKTTDSIQKQAMRENEHIQAELEAARKEWEVTNKNANSKIVQQQFEIDKLTKDLYNLQDQYDNLKLKADVPDALSIAQQDRIKDLEHELEAARYDAQVALENQKGKFDMIITRLKNQLKKYTNQSFNIDSDDNSMLSKFEPSSPGNLSSKASGRFTGSLDLKRDPSFLKSLGSDSGGRKNLKKSQNKDKSKDKAFNLENITEKSEEEFQDVSGGLPKRPGKTHNKTGTSNGAQNENSDENESEFDESGVKKNKKKGDQYEQNDQNINTSSGKGIKKQKKPGKDGQYEDDSDDADVALNNKNKGKQPGKTGGQNGNEYYNNTSDRTSGKSAIKNTSQLKEALQQQLKIENGKPLNIQEIFELLNSDMSLDDLYKYRKQIDEMINKLGGSVPKDANSGQTLGQQQHNGAQQNQLDFKEQNMLSQQNNENQNCTYTQQSNQQIPPFSVPPDFQFKCQKCGQMSGISQEELESLNSHISRHISQHSSPHYSTPHGAGYNGQNVSAKGGNFSGQLVNSPGIQGQIGNQGQLGEHVSQHHSPGAPGVDLGPDDLIVQENTSLMTGSTPNYSRRPGAPLHADNHSTSRPDSQLHNTPSLDQYNQRGQAGITHSPISGLNSKPQQILRKDNQNNGQNAAAMTEAQITEFNIQQLEKLLKSSRGSKNYDMILHAIRQNQQLWDDIRALEEVNELQEAAEEAKNVQQRDFAVQVSPGYDDVGTAFDVDQERADMLAEAAVNRHMKIKQKVRGKQPFNKLHGVVITGYKKVRGANVFERLYNYAKVLRAKIEQRSRDLTMMGFKGVDLGNSEVYAQNFYYKVGTGIKQTPRREKYVKED